MLTVAGKVIRVPGEGLLRVDETKSAAGRRTIPLPRFAVDADEATASPLPRRADCHLPVHGRHPRDPNNFLKQWRSVREELGVRDATTHSFRKTVSTLIDDEGLSARIGADHLGHATPVRPRTAT